MALYLTPNKNKNENEKQRRVYKVRQNSVRGGRGSIQHCSQNELCCPIPFSRVVAKAREKGVRDGLVLTHRDHRTPNLGVPGKTTTTTTTQRKYKMFHCFAK
jgi:hypothetical protein